MDAERVWAKATTTPGPRETPRDLSFCSHAILGAEVSIVPDAREDPRFKGHPLVTGPPHIRFYAGAPMVTPSGHALGTVCVAGPEPRHDAESQRAALAAIARQAMAQLELRRSVGQLERQREVLIDVEKELVKRADALATAREISERQRRELELILDSLGEGVVVADREGRLVRFNPMAKRLTGIGATDVSPEQWSATYGVFLPDGSAPFPLASMPLYRALQGESTDGIPMIIRNPEVPDGVSISVSGRPLVDGKGRILGGVVVFHDVTEVRAHEARIEAMNRDLELRVMERTVELEAANRAKSRFLAVMSHELRTPLAATIGYAEMLMEDEPSPREVHETARKIQDAGQLLLHIIDQILDFTLVESGKIALNPTTFSVPDLVEELSREVRAAVEEHGNRLAVEPSTGLASLHCDRARLKQVLSHLLRNAAKFTERGDVRFAAEQDGGGEARFRISDTGIGIGAEQRAQLFQPFVQGDASASRRHGGIGLGLVLCKRLTELMRGSIEVESREGSGTTFVVTIPAPAGAVTG